jgi:hypothetical protein
VSQKAPVPGGDLAQLLAALRSAPDSWSRLKLVASGARTLAKLTPQQRVQLLRQLGLQGAEELAEAAAGGDAQTAAAMTGALKALEADPRRLQQLAGAIADPSSRRATLMGLGAHVIETVTAPAPAPAKTTAGGKAGSASGGAPSNRGGAPAAPPKPPPAPPAQQAAAAGASPPRLRDELAAATALLTGAEPSAPQPTAPPAQPATPAPPAQPTTPATPQPATPPSLPPMPHPSPSTPQPPPVAPPAPAQPITPPATPPSLPQPVHPVTPPAPTADSTTTLDSLVAAAPAPAATPALVVTELAPAEPSRRTGTRVAAIGTLRELRRRLAGGEALAADDVSTLFAEELPQGWARRRALAALFAERRPERLDDALALVAQVGSPVDRRWALADLAASRAWEEGDWARLVATAGGDGERRRLALRRSRA